MFLLLNSCLLAAIAVIVAKCTRELGWAQMAVLAGMAAIVCLIGAIEPAAGALACLVALGLSRRYWSVTAAFIDHMARRIVKPAA